MGRSTDAHLVDLPPERRFSSGQRTERVIGWHASSAVRLSGCHDKPTGILVTRDNCITFDPLRRDPWLAIG